MTTPKEEVERQRSIIEFLKSNPEIKKWWDEREANNTMDVPMMLVTEIEYLLKNFNKPNQWVRNPKLYEPPTAKVGNFEQKITKHDGQPTILKNPINP